VVSFITAGKTFQQDSLEDTVAEWPGRKVVHFAVSERHGDMHSIEGQLKWLSLRSSVYDSQEPDDLVVLSNFVLAARTKLISLNGENWIKTHKDVKTMYKYGQCRNRMI
jgi:hypothetical protein